MTRGGIIADEVLTPDSSRFWDFNDWLESSKKKKSPSSLDKEFVRKWGKEMGIDKLDPTNPEHIAKVEAMEVPRQVIEDTLRIYRYIFFRLTGEKLENFQRKVMNIDASPPKVRISVVVGSKSDLSQCLLGLEQLKGYRSADIADFELNVISCHRNPQELQDFAERRDADVFIAGAGWAAALPGILKAQLRKFSKEIPVIGVAFASDDPKKTLAAQLSITELPGSPVIVDKDGQAFTGPQGFCEACNLAVNAEFLSAKAGAAKPAEFNIDF
jgi:phosphoribosylcarboxyaminoimidazole (NCAIR) mutase